eukprot:SAG25_NODE_161_length_13366_cov_13.111973_9_plen_98_part_00
MASELGGCVQNGESLGGGGWRNRRHSLVNCDHGDSIDSCDSQSLTHRRQPGATVWRQRRDRRHLLCLCRARRRMTVNLVRARVRNVGESQSLNRFLS